jgi:6,7-dimethyl-8-ribityllumazine synthase
MQRDDLNCIIALGLIIRGDTHHADLVASSVTQALQNLAVQHCLPVIHEVLLVEDEKQAHARCIAASMNRGREAARAAAGMIDVFSEIEKSTPKLSPNKFK